MPLYICNTRKGALDAHARAAIAQDITDIHCDVTGAPPIFVHAAFFEESAGFPLDDKALYVRGTIRKGRSDGQKEEIAQRIVQSLTRHGGVDDSSAAAQIRETPASWVLEGGEIMPEPGEEAAWFEAHKAARSEAPS
ncbi:MAG: tautomerase family protein [Pseudomonadota bacterium]